MSMEALEMEYYAWKAAKERISRDPRAVTAEVCLDLRPGDTVVIDGVTFVVTQTHHGNGKDAGLFRLELERA